METMNDSDDNLCLEEAPFVRLTSTISIISIFLTCESGDRSKFHCTIRPKSVLSFRNNEHGCKCFVILTRTEER